jgi:Arc/MetJ-type ribon-helix-helix transcriptional regulator
MVATGQYASVSDAVADGVRLLMSRQKLYSEIQQGIGELNAGMGIEGSQVLGELRLRAQRLKQQEA